MKRFLWFWMPALIWMAVIFAASSDLMSAHQTSRFIGPFLRWLLPDVSLETIAALQLAVRKCAHLIEYALLGALLWRAFAFGTANAWAPGIRALVIAICWAAFDEFRQSFIPSRSGSPVDVMIDVSGAIIGIGICVSITRRVKARARRQSPML